MVLYVHTLLCSRETQVSGNIMFSSATQPPRPPPRPPPCPQPRPSTSKARSNEL